MGEVMTAKWRSAPWESTEFGIWLRNHTQLPSIGITAYACTDIDLLMIWHRYVYEGCRLRQVLMPIEIKTNGAKRSPSQDDTLRKVGFMMSGREHNLYGQLLRCPGDHTIRLSETTPENSDEIHWDDKLISVSDLIDILQFKVHPTTFKANPHWEDF